MEFTNYQEKKYVFILCPPFSGSTLLVDLIGTSKSASVFASRRHEGQFLEETEKIMRNKPWNNDAPFPWKKIRNIYEENWDMTKPVLVEKSPPNLIRAKQIEREFEKAFFIIMIRNPYAWCFGMKRRKASRNYSKLAEEWLERAKTQIFNIKNLQNTLYFTYEFFTENPNETKNKIAQFIPELNDIDITKQFTIHSFIGTKKKPITNLNIIAISKLKENEIKEISQILIQEKDVLKFFSYEILPS